MTVGAWRLWVLLGRSPTLPVAAVLLAFSYGSWRGYLSVPHPPEKSTYSDPTICKNILATTGLDSGALLNRSNIASSPFRNVIPGVTSRSLPNKRLRETFGVDNSFTTLDEEYCQRFRNSAERKLNLTAKTWEEVGRIALQLVDHQLVDAPAVGLVEIVQLLSLKTILFVLFDIDPLNVDDEASAVVAKEINRLWLGSKGRTEGSSLALVDEGKLARALRTVVPDMPQGFLFTYAVPMYRSLQSLTHRILPTIWHGMLPPVEVTSRTNPLNLILPAYETLWRVVLRCFVEVAFRGEADSPHWRQIVVAFVNGPSLVTLRNKWNQTGVSAEHIVNEALRLYPPTRRIYRRFQLPDESPQDVAADLEECHRRQDIWGEDSLKFKPSRWKNAKADAEDKEKMPYAAFMPFGVKRFLCPATKDFGPRMIALLVGALVTKIQTPEWKLVAGDASDAPVYSDEPLNSGRHAFWSYQLVRQETGEGP
ncbi:MAG: hypothetical protein M1815_001795 [Lichina confinis]|nr:MAG: hypothetical protein M1815_001795 [Lichina confinis]